MNKPIATLALAAVALFGLTACSSGETEPVETPAPTETQPPAATTPTEAAESTSLDEDTLQNCLDLQGPMSKATADMQQIQAAGGDSMDQWQKSWEELEKALDEIAKSSSNAEFKNAAGAAYDDAVTIGDLMPQISNGDVNAASDMATAHSDFNKSYSALLGLCTP